MNDEVPSMAAPPAVVKRSKTPLVVGVAVIAIVAIVLAMTRKTTTPPPPPQIVAVSSDASIALDAPDAPAEPTTFATIDERCQAGCTAARVCGLMTPTCVADCKRDEQMRACTDLALAKNCRDAAMCGLRTTCGTKEFAQGTCLAAMTCQSQKCAANDFACGCACASGIATRNVLALMRVDVCAMNCDYDEPCIRQRCMTFIQSCAMQ